MTLFVSLFLLPSSTWSLVIRSLTFFLSFVLQITLKFFPCQRQLLNDSSHLKSFTEIHPLSWISNRIVCKSWTWLITILEFTILYSKKQPTINFLVLASLILYFYSNDLKAPWLFCFQHTHSIKNHSRQSTHNFYKGN